MSMIDEIRDPTVEPTKGEIAMQKLKALAKKNDVPQEVDEERANAFKMASKLFGRSTPCPSTHGAAGYASGDTGVLYKSKETGLNIRMDITCNICGQVIKRAPATGFKTVYYKFKENPFKWIFMIPKGEEPQWPNWINCSVKYI